LKKKYGKIYIRFHEPFSIKEFLESESAPQEARHSLAYHIARAINAVSPVTPRSLLALAILTVHRRGFLPTELTATAATLIGFLEHHKIPRLAALKNIEQTVRETLALMLEWKIVEVLEDATGTEENFYYVDDERKIELEYYKNNIIHFFIPYSFVAVLLLAGHEEEKNPAMLVADYLFLQNLFQYEFIFEKDTNPEERVRAGLAYFQEAGFLRPNDEPIKNYKLTKLGFEKLPIFAGLIKTFLESYWIAAKVMNQAREKIINKEDLIENMTHMGKRFHRLGVIDHIGALSRLNFENALNLIQEELLNGSADNPQKREQSRETLNRFGQKLYALARYGQ
jgi:glycerol-3-phosphate O-acyltransferase